MLSINVAVVLVTLISPAHAVEQNATVQTDTAPIENPPLPRPRPSLLDATGDNPAVLISAFRHRHGEDSVVISAALTRLAQEQANAMARRDSLDHDALAPFSNRIGRSGLSRAAENIAYGNADFASTLKQWTNSAGHRANLLLTARSGLALPMRKMATEFTGQWSSGQSKRQCGFICRAQSRHHDRAGTMSAFGGKADIIGGRRKATAVNQGGTATAS
jgi:Cysteine-rich secretory protein family